MSASIAVSGTMKALTLTQPWATLVAYGIKEIETRSWRTNYRGPLAIHAGKGWTKMDADFAASPDVQRLLNPLGIVVPPRGVVIAIARLIGCVPTEEYVRYSTRLAHELPFGDFSPGRYAWVLDKAWPTPMPIPAKGSLGLWDWTPPVLNEEPA